MSRVLIGVGVILWAAGCGVSCPTLRHASAASLRASYGSRHAVVGTLRAEASVEQFAEDGRVRGKVLMFVATPDRLRFDVMTDFGPAAVLTSDGVTFSLSDFQNRQYLEGPACPANIARILGVPLHGDEATRLLLGQAPRSLGGTSSLTCEEGGYLLRELEGQRLLQALHFAVHDDDRERSPADQRLLLTEWQRFSATGEVAWRATYDDHRPVALPDGVVVTMPFRVRVEDSAHDVDTTVRFRELALNVDVPEAAFSQSPAAGLERVRVPCEPEGESVAGSPASGASGGSGP